MSALGSDEADHKTLELIAEQGPAQADLSPLFEGLEPDAAGSFDGVHDEANFPLSAQPKRVLRDLDTIQSLA